MDIITNIFVSIVVYGSYNPTDPPRTLSWSTRVSYWPIKGSYWPTTAPTDQLECPTDQ